MKILDTIHSPDDLKRMSYDELEQLAFDLRAYMVAATSIHGGHLASSLGAVELIIALHRVLDCPSDKIVFDVGHQAYAHKMITGRLDGFKHLRSLGGLSGFPKIDESPFDAHDAGHASDALSIAYGYCMARDLDGSEDTVAALVGDASFAGGMAMEALNNIGHSGTRMIIVLNDNGMSISPSVGGFAASLARARSSAAYVNVRAQVEGAFNSRGKVGRALMRGGNMVKESVKQFVAPGDMFLEGYGLTYLGPIDGHDIATLETILSNAKEMDGPVVVHAVTKKGRGYAPAEANPGLFHGVGPFEIDSGRIVAGSDAPSWTSVFGDELVKIARNNSDVVALTAAMKDGTGLASFAREFPERFFDVGISEEHAVGMASSLALAGKVPIVAIYSTFLQRAFDQIMINVALQKQHVVFAVDRAGLVGADGPTHHGAFDLSYLRVVPGMEVLAPSCAEELKDALRYAVFERGGPVAIRYGRGLAPESIDGDAGSGAAAGAGSAGADAGSGAAAGAGSAGADAGAGNDAGASAGNDAGTSAGNDAGAFTGNDAGAFTGNDAGASVGAHFQCARASSDEVADGGFKTRRARCLREGADAAILAVGDMVARAVTASDILRERGREVSVWDMRFVKPIDEKALDQASRCGLIFTLEDNSIVGGFGSAVLEGLAALSLDTHVEILGLPDDFIGQGGVDELLTSLGLDAPSIADTIEARLS